jgi:hypothetical protein
MYFFFKKKTFLSHMIYPTDLLHPSPAPHFKTSQVFLICCPKRPSFSNIQSRAPNVTLYKVFPQIQVQVARKNVPM